MSIIINGGSGGGITVETDPTALKIANNLSDVSSQEQSRDNIGLGPTSSPIFSGLTIYSQNGNPSQILFSQTGGMAIKYQPEISSGSWNIHLPALDVVGSIDFTTDSLFPNQQCGFIVNYPILANAGIVFSDGTIQTTAGGGGGGGGGGLSYSQRLADGFASNVMAFSYESDVSGTYHFVVLIPFSPSSSMYGGNLQPDGNIYNPAIIGDGFELPLYYGSYENGIYGWYFKFITSPAVIPISSDVRIRFTNGWAEPTYGDSYVIGHYDIV